MIKPDAKMLVLDMIASSIRERGFAPTLREIAVELGWRPTDTPRVHALLTALERAGRIARVPYRSREIMVLDHLPKRPAGMAELERIAVTEAYGVASMTVDVGALRRMCVYTQTLERLLMDSTKPASENAPVRNRWPGTCHRCGETIPRGEGVVLLIEGKWRTHHPEHSGLTAEQLEALPEVGPKAPTEEERAKRGGRSA